MARVRRPLGLWLALAVALAGLIAVQPPAAAQSAGDEATGASPAPLPPDATVLHVDGDRDVASPDGSAERPFPTVNWALAGAQYLRTTGEAVRVVIAPGTYREALSLGGALLDPPLVVEAQEPGTVVVSGAELETRWTPVAGTERFWAPWEQQWGLAPIPPSWGDIEVADVVRRREVVLVDGDPLTQVVAEEDLEPGTFLVDEEESRLVVHPPAGVDDLREGTVEVSERTRALHLRAGARNVTVRGLVFEAAAAGLDQHMAYVSDARDVLLEGNTFRHSGWGGLGVCCTTGVTVRDSVARDNGGNGLDTYRAGNVVVEGNTVESNNLRGIEGGYSGWSVAGSKHLVLHRAVFRDNVYRGNWARGLWFDTDVQDVVLDGERSCANLREGLFIEAVQGPFSIRDAEFCDNLGGGIVSATSGNVTVTGSRLAGNAYGQLVFTGERFRSWTDRLTGALIEMGDLRNWTLTDNELVSDGEPPAIYSPVIPEDEWRALLEDGEIVAEGNQFVRPSLEGAIRIRGTAFPLEEWRRLTGDDATTATTSGSEPQEDSTEEPDPAPAEPDDSRGPGNNKGNGPGRAKEKPGKGGENRGPKR